jgi:hypothetical protein
MGASRPNKETKPSEEALPLAPAIATFIFRASLVQTGYAALRERNPAIAVATSAGVGQGQGVSVRTATAEPFKSHKPPPA